MRLTTGAIEAVRIDSPWVKASSAIVRLDRATAARVDGKVEKTPVRIGLRDGAHVELLDGLAGDQPVVLMANQPLSDHQAVTVTEGK